MKSFFSAALIVCFAASAGAATFSDANFGSGWTSTIFSKSPFSATMSATTQPTGGVGGTPFHQVQHNGYTGLFTGHVNAVAVWSGPISTIDYSFDVNTIAGSNTVAYRFLIFQNGTYYSAGSHLAPAGWTSVSNTINRNDFTSIYTLPGFPQATDFPDFSCNAPPITFGYWSVGNSGPIASATTGLDNWQMTVHPDPTATGCCMSADVDKVTCNSDGTFTVTTTVTNMSSNPTQSVLVAPPPGATYTVTPNVIAAPLNGGQSTSITLTVSGATSNQTICLDFFLQDASGGTCCLVKRCFTLPECACLEVLNAVLNCVPDSQGYPYTFTLHNLSSATIQQVFAIPSTGTISPQLLTVSIPGGGSMPITLHLSGVQPGDRVCIVLQAYWDNQTECCTVRVCVDIPEPCL